ncbi:ArsR/SmtB family transcription factor [Thalassobaculum salexigens]|uniref:ArsR/SmtB family transcription factor n=2 Tax=Thalassobaculum salexigens TaxID=455360 RepID=UPI00040AB913|nr:helix-turn-helix transcriptional regulator [Thalassobaculum salexigens]
MVNTNRMAEIGLLIGEPARAAMLGALMDGRALTAGELAGVAGVAPQTASGHLARLAEANLLAVERQGRHRYHRLASPEVAELIESVMRIAAVTLPDPTRMPVTGPRDAQMRLARTCYDHLAGGLGVAVTDALVARDVIAFDDGAGIVTPNGMERLAALGIAVNAPTTRVTRPLCRPCLDWSERRPHLAGRLGAAVCSHFIEQHWVTRVAGSRALHVTPKGQQALRERFGIAGMG